MAKVSGNQAPTGQVAPAQKPRQSNSAVNFSDLLQKSRELAQRLSIHKGYYRAESPANLPQSDNETPSPEPADRQASAVNNIANSPETLLGKLRLIRQIK